MFSYIPVLRNDAGVNDDGCFVILVLDLVCFFCFFEATGTDLLPLFLSVLPVVLGGSVFKRFAIREDCRVLLVVEESAIVGGSTLLG